MNKSKTVYLIDDDEAVRIALKLLLQTIGLEVSCFASPLEFLSVFNKFEPGCIVVDIRMPEISGLKLQEKLTENNCRWPVIVISGHGDIEACRRAFRNGAVDFLSKPVDEQDLIDAIQKAHSQLENQVLIVAEQNALKTQLAQLTIREKEVLDLITNGFSTKEIANNLELSPRTIETYRSNLSTKLGTTSVAELTRLYIDSNKI